MAYPKPAEKIKLNDPMLGGKFRTYGFRGVISLLYLLFLSSGKKSTVEFSKIYSGDVAQLKDEIVSFINTFLGVQRTKDDYNKNYLLSGQYESIKTSLERIFRIGKLQFIDDSLPGGAERKTKKRYEKRIKFTTNMLVLDMIISSHDKDTIKNVLNHWLNNEGVNKGKSEENYFKSLDLEWKIATYFSTLTQEGLYRIRQNGEIIFRPIGIYDELLEGNTVSFEDEHEIVGTSSGYKNFIKENLDPWLSMNASSTITPNHQAIVELADYAEMVRTQLDISYVLFETENKEKQLDIDFSDTDLKHEQIIYFGAPGTGKSFKVEHRKGETEKDRIRTTFHPDSDYSSFVGCYKPMQNPKNEDKIIYKFEGQCFTIAYIEAWKRLVNLQENQNINFTLVIEEINRGNCAQIFGDIFQLLDRNEKGFSQYSIRPDEDLAAHLKEQFKEVAEKIKAYEEGKYAKIADGTEMRLPPNLSIIATMNTSDQSLFPIDSAFKRRWEWEYIPILYSPKKDDRQIKYLIDIDGTIYDWSSFIREVNKRVFDITKSEDKQLGYFFVRPDNGDCISMKRFVSKVIFYLWSDIYKDYPKTTRSVFYFDEEYHTFNSFFEGDNIQADFVCAFIENLGINDIKDENQMSQIEDNNGVPFNKKKHDKIKDIIEEMNKRDMATLATDPQFTGYSPGGGVPFIGTQVIEDRSKLSNDDPKHISESSYKKYRGEQYDLKDGYYLAVYNLSKNTLNEIRKKLGIEQKP